MVKEKITAMKEKHPVLLCLIVLLLVEAGMWMVKGGMSLAGFGNDGSNLYYMIKELLYCGIGLAFVKIFNLTRIFKETKNFWRSFLSAGLVVMIILLSLVTFIPDISGDYKSVVEIVSFPVLVLAIGFFEETLYRGIVVNLLADRFCGSVKGVWATAAISGFLFGFLHFFNVFVGQSLQETVLQMIQISFFGILLGAIYLKNRNIYSMMLLHALYDGSRMIARGLNNGWSIMGTDDNGSFDLKKLIILNIIYCSIYLIATAVILRPKSARKIAGISCEDDKIKGRKNKKRKAEISVENSCL